jgi:hypothetical protein
MGKTVISFLALFRIFYMPFKLIPEMPDCCSHGPGGGISQGANRIALDPALDIPQ